MRQDASPGATSGDAALRAPLTAFEDPDFDEEQAEATLSAAGAPSTRRYAKRPSLRILPWVVLAIVAGIVLVSLPGGLSVLICAAKRTQYPNDLHLIGYRGTEWPYPGNTLRAARASALKVHAVHLDLSLSGDGEAYAITGKLDMITNGSGLLCARNRQYVSSLSVSPPNYDPSGRAIRAPMCEETRVNGTHKSCLYRVPSLDRIFGDLPSSTRYLLQVDSCGTSLCGKGGAKCALASRVEAAAKAHFITPQKLSLVASNEDAIQSFRSDIFFANADYVFIAGHAYAHYSPESFVNLLHRGRWDGVAFTPALVAWRPDIYRAVVRATAVRTTCKLIGYVLPIRTSWDLKISTCAGARNLVVSDVAKVLSMLGKSFKLPK